MDPYFFSHIILSLRFNKSQNKTQFTVLQQSGQHIFKELARNVKSLTTSMRIESNDNQMKAYCAQIRSGEGLTPQQAAELLTFKISSPLISSNRRKYLMDHAVWIYTTNAEVKEHNMEKMHEIVTQQNPLMNFSYQILPTEANTTGKGVHSHFEKENRLKAPVGLCRTARVSLTRNIWQEVGLYNGATGAIVDIRMQKDTSPLSGDFPAYIIVDMDDYNGPIWDQHNPSHVPIPITDTYCNKPYSCCKMRTIPLEIAYARTLHKFQGRTVGPDHPFKCMVFSPGTAAFEAVNPGLLYTGLSRATTLGCGDINSSSIYFSGSNATFDRFTNLKYFRTKNKQNQIYLRVRQRERWVQYLDQQQTNSQPPPSIDVQYSLQNWLQNQIPLSIHELDDILLYHKNYS